MLSPEETIAALNEEDLAEEAQVEAEAETARVLVHGAFEELLDGHLCKVLVALTWVIRGRLYLRGVECVNDLDAAAWAIEHYPREEQDG